jgi:hypothetical protein
MARAPRDDWDLYFAPDGFIYHEHLAAQAPLGSDVTYCTMINPLLGANERVYPISRVIPPGEAERFHILVGATKSAALRLRFKFSIGKDAVITSDEFTVHIWNPIGSGLNYQYVDGQHLMRRVQELKTKAALDDSEKREIESVERELWLARLGLGRGLSSFPYS